MRILPDPDPHLCKNSLCVRLIYKVAVLQKKLIKISTEIQMNYIKTEKKTMQKTGFRIQKQTNLIRYKTLFISLFRRVEKLVDFLGLEI